MSEPFRAVLFEPADFERRFLVPAWVSYVGIVIIVACLASFTAHPWIWGFGVGIPLLLFVYWLHDRMDTPEPRERRVLEISEDEIRVRLRRGDRLIDNYPIEKATLIGVEPSYTAADVLLDRHLRFPGNAPNELILDIDEDRHRFLFVIGSNEMRERLDRLVREWRTFELPVVTIERRKRPANTEE